MKDFKTHDGKKCGQCKIRLTYSGYCIHELGAVKRSDSACKRFIEVGT